MVTPVLLYSSLCVRTASMEWRQSLWFMPRQPTWATWLIWKPWTEWKKWHKKKKKKYELVAEGGGGRHFQMSLCNVELTLSRLHFERYIQVHTMQIAIGTTRRKNKHTTVHFCVSYKSFLFLLLRSHISLSFTVAYTYVLVRTVYVGTKCRKCPLLYESRAGSPISICGALQQWALPLALPKSCPLFVCKAFCSVKTNLPKITHIFLLSFFLSQLLLHVVQ